MSLIKLNYGYIQNLLKKFMLYEYYPFKTTIYLTFVILSWLYYPNYSMLKYPISNLGNWYFNPYPGWFFFSIGSFIEGILLIPYVIMLFRILNKISYLPVVAATSANFTGIVGLILIAFFPNVKEFYYFHSLGAFLSFSGFFIANLFYWVTISVFIKEKDINFNILLTFSILTISVPVFFGLFIYQFIYSSIYGVLQPFFEWIMYFIIISQSFSVYLTTLFIKNKYKYSNK
ncbi:MAG: hypothetical protein ACTSRP_05375 [Candidatus Helarchaeota archaeon]